MLAVHLIAIAGFSSFRATRFDLAKPPTVTLLTLLSKRSVDSNLDLPPAPSPSHMTTFAPILVPIPELVTTSPAQGTTGHVTIDGPCLRTSSDPAQADADRRDCERHLQLPGGLHLDEDGNLVGDPAGAVRTSPEDKAEVERLDLNLKAQFGGPESHENPVDRERLPEIPVETWQKIEIRNRDNSR